MTKGDTGACRAGLRRCEQVAWGACEGEALPAVEDCESPDDDRNCDGRTACSDAACAGAACSTPEGQCTENGCLPLEECPTPCADGEECRQGACVSVDESICSNAIDDDADGATDCADASGCPAETSCGAGLVCRTSLCVPSAEANCANSNDDDHDGNADCTDPDCEDRACDESPAMTTVTQQFKCSAGQCSADTPIDDPADPCGSDAFNCP